MADISPERPIAAPPSPNPSRIAAEILRQVSARGTDRSICPSEVARALGADTAREGAADAENWQRLLAPVRRAARDLAREGRIDILRKGKPIDPATEPRGVIRLRLRSGPT